MSPVQRQRVARFVGIACVVAVYLSILRNFTSIPMDFVQRKRVETRTRCTNLLILRLSPKTTNESLRRYFEKFGDVPTAQVEKQVQSGKSEGFVKLAHKRFLSTRHCIDGKWFKVTVPGWKHGMVHQAPPKLIVGRCTGDVTAEDLREYFSKFGEVLDVLKPICGLSFVTFLDPEVAQSLCGKEHIVKGVPVRVADATPKTEQSRNKPSNGNYGSHHVTPNQQALLPHGRAVGGVVGSGLTGDNGLGVSPTRGMMCDGLGDVKGPNCKQGMVSCPDDITDA